MDNTFLCCILVALLTLIICITFWQGMQATDDLAYSLNAYHVLKYDLVIQNTSHQVGRIATYLPLAFVFWLFGINNLSLCLIPVLSTVITSVLLFLLGKKLFDTYVGLVAGFLYAIFPLTLRYGNIFIPEPMLGAELCAAALLFLHPVPNSRSFFNDKKLASGLLAGLAYLTTEVGAIIIPTFLIYNFISRKASRKDWSFVTGFLVIFFMEMAFFNIVYGNPFYRFTGLGMGYINDPMLHSSNQHLLYRLFKAYPRLFIFPNGGLGFFGLLLIVAGIYAIFKVRNKGYLFLLIWAGAIFGFYNFMSVRLDKYVVLPVALRLIYPGCLPLLILGSKFLTDLWKWIKERAYMGRIVLQVFFAISVIWLFITSILIGYFNLNISFTSILARNAEAAASFFKNESSVIVVSDNRTLQAISFYREFSGSDSLIEFKQSTQLQCNPGKLREKEYVVINGLVYNISEGQSGFFPYDYLRYNIMDEALRSDRDIKFRFKYKKGSLYHRLMSLGICRKLLGEYGCKLAEIYISGKNASGWIIIL
ncbi:MAG: glycosyltransferase family 39 protein [bacterium]